MYEKSQLSGIFPKQTTVFIEKLYLKNIEKDREKNLKI